MSRRNMLNFNGRNSGYCYCTICGRNGHLKADCDTIIPKRHKFATLIHFIFTQLYIVLAPLCSSRRQRPYVTFNQRRCYRCRVKGHIAASCPGTRLLGISIICCFIFAFIYVTIKEFLEKSNEFQETLPNDNEENYVP